MVKLLDDVKRFGITPHNKELEALAKAIVKDTVTGVNVIDMSNVVDFWASTFRTMEANQQVISLGPSVLPLFDQGFIESRVTAAFNYTDFIGYKENKRHPEIFGFMYLVTDNWDSLTGSAKYKGEDTRKLVESNIKNNRDNAGNPRFSFLAVGDDSPIDPVRWTLTMHLIVKGVSYGRGKPYGPVQTFMIYVTPDGRVTKSSNGTPIVLGLNPIKPNVDMPLTMLRNAMPWVYPALLSFMFMRADNAMSFQTLPVDSVAASYRAKTGMELSRPFYITVGQDQKTKTEIIGGHVPTIGEDSLKITPGTFRISPLSGKYEWISNA